MSIAKAYRVWVFQSGTTSASSSVVDFVLGSSQLAAPPTVLGPTPRPLEGRVEPRPWYVDVVDKGGSFTAHLADGSGRMLLTNRLVQAQVATNGGAYTPYGCGRITDVEMSTDVASYRLTVSPETQLLSGNTIFSTNTTRLYPGGPNAAYGPYPPPPGAVMHVLQFNKSNGPKTFFVGLEWTYWPMTDTAVQAVQNDQSPVPNLANGLGNFQWTRMRVSGSDYPIQTFGWVQQLGNYLPNQHLLNGFGDTSVDRLYAWIIVPTSGTFTVGNSYSSAFLHMFGGPPSEATPLHIGGVTGIHPMTLAKNLLDGSYPPASGQPKARYSTAAFNNGTTGVQVRSMAPNWFRITGPQSMGSWIEDHLWAPNQVVPFIDGQGRITPRYIGQPDSTSLIGHAFTASNMRKPHPTFLVPQREQTTVLQINSVYESTGLIQQTSPREVLYDIRTVSWPPGVSADLLRAVDVASTISLDRVQNFGRIVTQIQAQGVRVRTPSFFALGIQFSSNNTGNLGAYTANLQHSVLNRFGDGPIFATVYGMSDASTVQAGDWCSVALPSYPNPRLNARGGTRYMQVMSRDDPPDGPIFSMLDGGAALPGLGAPSVVGTMSTFSAKHIIVASVGNIPTSGKLQLQAALSTTSTAPSGTSSLWQTQYTSANSTGAYNIGKRPAGSKTFLRARVTAPARVPSGWSVSGGVVTSGLASPTGMATSSLTAGTVTLKWTNGETAYPTRVYLDTSTGAALTQANALANVSAGSVYFPIRGLVHNSKHLGAVAHFDPYGGLSGFGKKVFTSPSTGTSSGGGSSGYSHAPTVVGGHITAGDQ